MTPHQSFARGIFGAKTRDDSPLVGVLCGCDMDGADPDAPVGTVMSSCPLFVGPAARLAEAAETIERYGVGALPVLSLDGRLVGVVTRSDLRRHGALPGQRGVDSCASCGAIHSLSPRGVNDVCFCKSCWEAARQASDQVVDGGEG